MTMTIRLLACAAAAAIAAPALASGTAAATATATAAGPDGASVTAVHDGDGAGGTERVIVLTDRQGGDAADGAADGERHRVRVLNLDGDHLADCGPDRRVIERTSPDGHERSKVVLCTRGEAVSAEDRSARLEHVLERIQHMDGLSDASKERVTAALRGAIEELRNSH